MLAHVLLANSLMVKPVLIVPVTALLALVPPNAQNATVDTSSTHKPAQLAYRTDYLVKVLILVSTALADTLSTTRLSCARNYPFKLKVCSSSSSAV